jgi:DNA-binding transcriptional ArsR family regulator
MRRTGAGKGAVQRELRRLSDAGILTRSVRGREVYYQADRQAAGAPSKITREDLRLICFDVVSGG